METVAVVVVTYNSAPLLPDLLSSLPAGLGDLAWRLVVVDNDSSDGSLAAAGELRPGAVLVQTGRNAGYAAGINAGVAAAGDFTAVLVLNPDVRLLPGCVPELVSALRRTGSGLAVPHLVDGAGDLIETIRREPSVRRILGDAVVGARRAGRRPAWGEVETRPEQYAHERVVDWAEGSTVLFSAECWDACGPWDESFFLYSEETDFALRAKDLGLPMLYVPSAHAVHLEGDSGTSPGLWALLTANRVKLFRSRRGPVPTALFWSALVLREGSRAVTGNPRGAAGVRVLLSRRRMAEDRGPRSVRAR